MPSTSSGRARRYPIWRASVRRWVESTVTGFVGAASQPPRVEPPAPELGRQSRRHLRVVELKWRTCVRNWFEHALGGFTLRGPLRFDGRPAKLRIMSQPSPLSTPLPWDLVAAEYSVDIAPFFERFADRALAKAAVEDHHHIVDVATGPGTLAFRARGLGARVTAIDFSEEMIAQLATNAAARGDAAHLTVRHGDGQALPFADAHFDAGFSMFGLMFFPDRDRGFRELRRVVKAGGHVVVSSWVPLDQIPILATAFSALREQLPNLPPPPPELPLASEERAVSEMSAAGFRDVTAERHTESMTATSTRALWDRMSRNNAPIVMLRHRLGEATWAPVASAIEARLLDRFGDGPQSIPMTAIFTSGRA